MVVVPNVCPDTPPLRKNPVFLYFQDRFQKPNPFRPDVVVAIDDVLDTKIERLDAHVSQFYEWLPWVDGSSTRFPKDARRAANGSAKTHGPPSSEPVREALRGGTGRRATRCTTSRPSRCASTDGGRRRTTCGACSRSLPDPYDSSDLADLRFRCRNPGCAPAAGRASEFDAIAGDLGASVNQYSLAGLRQCMKDLGLRRGIVVTSAREGRAHSPGIEIVPWERIVSGRVDLF